MATFAYRYANQETVLKMLKGQEIWFSDLRRMNDWDEYCAGYRIVANIITNDYPHLRDILDKISPDQMDTSFKILISSFSDDGDCLSMWRGYGDNGMGASIGYSTLDIENCSLFSRYLPKMAPISGKVLFFPVIYDKGHFEIEARKYLGTSPKAIVPDNHETGLDLRSKIHSGMLTLALMRLCTLYKNDFFVDEREVRGFIEINDTVDPYKTSIRNSDFGESEYHKLLTTYGGHPAIKEVILGPKNNISTEAMKEALDDIGLTNVKIKKSRGTYR